MTEVQTPSPQETKSEGMESMKGAPAKPTFTMDDALGILDQVARANGIQVVIASRYQHRAGPVQVLQLGPTSGGDALGILALATLGIEEDLKLEYRKAKASAAAAAEAAKATQ